MNNHERTTRNLLQILNQKSIEMNHLRNPIKKNETC